MHSDSGLTRATASVSAKIGPQEGLPQTKRRRSWIALSRSVISNVALVRSVFSSSVKVPTGRSSTVARHIKLGARATQIGEGQQTRPQHKGEPQAQQSPQAWFRFLAGWTHRFRNRRAHPPALPILKDCSRG